MSIELPDLIGKEKQHYESLDELYSYSCGKKVDEKELRNKLNETIDDWDKMMGGNSLKPSVSPYFQQLLTGDRTKARELYFFLSPIFFYIHVLFEMERKAWRNAMTSSGIFCERIVRNLIQEVDRIDSTDIWQELSKDQKFDNRNGRLRKELEAKKIDEADALCSLLKNIYHTRSHTGPHDVPPPEPIQADFSVRLCLPAYVNYLDVLIELGSDLKNNLNNYLSFFYSLTRTDIALVFGQEEIRKTPTEIIKEEPTDTLKEINGSEQSDAKKAKRKKLAKVKREKALKQMNDILMQKANKKGEGNKYHRNFMKDLRSKFILEQKDKFKYVEVKAETTDMVIDNSRVYQITMPPKTTNVYLLIVGDLELKSKLLRQIDPNYKSEQVFDDHSEFLERIKAKENAKVKESAEDLIDEEFDELEELGISDEDEKAESPQLAPVEIVNSLLNPELIRLKEESK